MLEQSSFNLTRIGRFGTVTPVLFHWWLCNDARSFEVAERRCHIIFQGHMSNCKVMRGEKLTISRRFERLRLVILIQMIWWLVNETHSVKGQGRGSLSLFEVIQQILVLFWFPIEDTSPYISYMIRKLVCIAHMLLIRELHGPPSQSDRLCMECRYSGGCVCPSLIWRLHFVSIDIPTLAEFPL